MALSVQSTLVFISQMIDLIYKHKM